ncbi:MAG: pitrilysin family protein [Bdellovibrionota bacterium]
MNRPLLVLLMVGISQLSFAVEPTPLPSISLSTPVLETLPNGLQIAWFHSDALPLIDLLLLVKSGSRDDPNGKSGVSQMVARTLDRGNGGKSGQEIAAAVEKLGASRFINSDDDTFTIGVHGLALDGAELLSSLANIALRPDFPEAEFRREKNNIGDEWRRLGENAGTLASVTFFRAVSAHTSYGRGDAARLSELTALAREDLREFHLKHFVPSNAILTVVGRYDRAAFRQKIVTAFGDWAGIVPTRNWKDYGDQRILDKLKRAPNKQQRGRKKKALILLANRTGVNQAHIRIGFKAPLINSPDHYALTVANALLGEYFGSRLNAVIRDRLGLTYGVNSGYQYSRGFAYFSIGTSTKNETVAQLITKSLDILEETRNGPLPEEEVGMAKEYLLGSFPVGTATLGSVASRWLSGVVFDRGADFLNEFIPNISKVSVADVTAALQRHFTLEDPIIVVGGDAKVLEKQLKDSGKYEVRLVSVADLL